MPVYVLILCLVSWPVLAEGFLGGMADGMIEAQRLELERRALDLDRQDSCSRFDALRQRHQMDEIKRLLEENNRLRREYEMRRMLR